MSDQKIEIEIDAINAPYWEALREGNLIYQECKCGKCWLPSRQRCPNCLSDEWVWKKSSGRGIIKSWVIFHVAYHPQFKDKLPYNVAIVKLDEGPQLITNIIGSNSSLRIGSKVNFIKNQQCEQPLALFSIVD